MIRRRSATACFPRDSRASSGYGRLFYAVKRRPLSCASALNSYFFTRDKSTAISITVVEVCYISRESQTTRNVQWSRASVCVCVSVCLSVCLSVRGRIPTLLHGPWCNLEELQGCPLVVHCWAELQSVHGLRCYDNIARTRNVSEYLYLLYDWLHQCYLITRYYLRENLPMFGGSLQKHQKSDLATTKKFFACVDSNKGLQQNMLVFSTSPDNHHHGLHGSINNGNVHHLTSRGPETPEWISMKLECRGCDHRQINPCTAARTRVVLANVSVS